MNCPYCAEEIKDAAIACRYCGRDLTFFKPIEQRLRSIEETVSAISIDLSKVSAILADREPIDLSIRESTFVGAIVKPNRLRYAMVVLLQVLLTAGVVAIYAALQVSIRPSFERVALSQSTNSDETAVESMIFERQYNEYYDRLRLITRIFIPGMVLIPIVVGFWIGIRWRGSHFKIYLILGSMSGLIEGLILVVLLCAMGEFEWAEIGYISLAVLINVARCTFGFVTGGLVGDRIEKRRYPNRYQNVLAEHLSKYLDSRVGSRTKIPAASLAPESKLKSLANAVTAFGPVLALIGTIAAAYFGYMGTTRAAAETAKAAQNRATSTDATKEPMVKR